MSLRLLNLRGIRPPFEQVLPRPADPGVDVYAAVAEVVRRVRAEGDPAIVEFTKRFDGVDVSEAAGGLRVPPEEIDAALKRVDPELRAALELAYQRIVDYHSHEGTPPGV